MIIRTFYAVKNYQMTTKIKFCVWNLIFWIRLGITKTEAAKFNLELVWLND